MDTMTYTKVAAALCGSLLVFLLGKWAAETIYHVGGHGEQAYVIETGATEVAEVAEEDVSFEVLMASADVEKGAKVFKKCSACHKLEAGENATGPYLYGVVGREIGAANEFGYSAALADHGGQWNYENLSGFLENPKGWAAGTSMGFAGLKKPEDRANVIAYLESISQ